MVIIKKIISNTGEMLVSSNLFDGRFCGT